MLEIPENPEESMENLKIHERFLKNPEESHQNVENPKTSFVKILKDPIKCWKSQKILKKF